MSLVEFAKGTIQNTYQRHITMARISDPGRICVFGTHTVSEAYSRNRGVQQALAACGYKVVECRAASGSGDIDRVGAFRNPLKLFAALRSLAAQWSTLISMHRRLAPYEAMIVGYPAHADVLLAWYLARRRRRPLIMDAFLGLYDTVVSDRKLVGRANPIAWLIWAWEWLALRLADRILLDTEEHADWIAESYRLARRRLAVVPVGINESIWRPSPLPPPDRPFETVFWGTFIPLHGAEVVAKAAHLAEQQHPGETHWTVIGDGQTADRFQNMLQQYPAPNLSWHRGFFPIEELLESARRAHCCIGVMGTGGKSMRVIPYKVYQALAAGRPVITADTPAIRRVLVPGQGARLVPPGDAQALADAVIGLAKDRKYLEQLARRGHATFRERLSHTAVERALRTVLEDLGIPMQGNADHARSASVR